MRPNGGKGVSALHGIDCVVRRHGIGFVLHGFEDGCAMLRWTSSLGGFISISLGLDDPLRQDV
jgi:hypothetical protein